MSTENIVTGKFYRILKDKTNHIWDRISYWTHADDVELSNGTSLSTDLTAKQTKIDATQSDFAQVETSPTTHAYVKGQMLLYNNQLYRVKAAIASGATLTVGTNIEVVSVSTLSSMLTATNGNQFYFDVKDGTPGFYPSASKTASQFVPFGGTQGLVEAYIFCGAQSARINMAYLYTKDAIYAERVYSSVVAHSEYIEVDSSNAGVKFKKACKYITTLQGYDASPSATITTIENAVVGTTISNVQVANKVFSLVIIG